MRLQVALMAIKADDVMCLEDPCHVLVLLRHAASRSFTREEYKYYTPVRAKMTPLNKEVCGTLAANRKESIIGRPKTRKIQSVEKDTSHWF